MQNYKNRHPTHDEIANVTKLLKRLPAGKRRDLLDYGNKMVELHRAHARVIEMTDRSQEQSS